MGVLTRKRVSAGVDDPAPAPTAKRSHAAHSPTGVASPRRNSPQGAAPGAWPAARRRPSMSGVPTKGSRGKAFLAAARIAVPSASPLSAAALPPKLSTRRGSAIKAACLVADEAAAPRSVLHTGIKPRNPLLQQELPRKLDALLDMFAGLQAVYEVMRKRGQRTTYQNMRQAVEEASGRRFLLSHVAQLQHLLPEVLAVEWVRLPVAAHSSRTEPHLLINLDMARAAGAAADSGAAPSAAAGCGELQAARHLLHCRLARHLLDSYRVLLEGWAAELRQAGDEAAAEPLEAAAQATAEPPVSQFVPPYPEGAADVPLHQLPPRPEAPTPASRGGSPSILGTNVAAASQQLAVPLTPVTASLKPPPSTGRNGRPPVHPNTVDRQRTQQRRLSFSEPAAAAQAAGTASQVSPCQVAMAVVVGRGGAAGRVTKPGTPLDKLHSQLEQQQRQQWQSQGSGLMGPQLEAVVHPKQAALAASLDPADLQFNGTILSEQDASLLASMPEELRRMSTDGIISLDTLRMLDAAEQQHRRLSSKEAQERRESSAALGQLPRTFNRLQRIFGVQGPNALKLREVVLRIKQGGAETTSEAQIEAQLRALADHAPDYLSLKPFGRCGTPALWINRGANGNTVMQRLKQVADGRLQQPGAVA